MSDLLFETKALDDDILALILKGDLNSTTTSEFNEVVNQHLEAGKTKIIIDCRDLGYISSIGIGALVTLKTRLNRKGGTVKLSTLRGPVADLIKAVKLGKILDIYGDLEFARESFYETPWSNAPESCVISRERFSFAAL